MDWRGLGGGRKMAAALGRGLDISLAALRQHDPYISGIVDVASQVALYTFGHRASQWVRARSRPDTPRHAHRAPRGRGLAAGTPRPLPGMPRPPARCEGGEREGPGGVCRCAPAGCPVCHGQPAWAR